MLKRIKEPFKIEGSSRNAVRWAKHVWSIVLRHSAWFPQKYDLSKVWKAFDVAWVDFDNTFQKEWFNHYLKSWICSCSQNGLLAKCKIDNVNREGAQVRTSKPYGINTSMKQIVRWLTNFYFYFHNNQLVFVP